MLSNQSSFVVKTPLHHTFKKRRFIDVNCSYPGSTSDSVAWLQTDIAKLIKAGLIPEGYYFVGDAAYPCLTNMLTPVPGSRTYIGGYTDDYNFFQSQTRINSE